MERFKPAAGRLSTIYYKRGALQKLAKSKADLESQDSELESPPVEMNGSDEKVLSPTGSQNTLPGAIRFSGRTYHLMLRMVLMKSACLNK